MASRLIINWNWEKSMEFLDSLANETENAEKKILENFQKARPVAQWSEIFLWKADGHNDSWNKGQVKGCKQNVYSIISLTVIDQILQLFFLIPFSKYLLFLPIYWFSSHKSTMASLYKKIKQTLYLSHFHLKSFQQS